MSLSDYQQSIFRSRSIPYKATLEVQERQISALRLASFELTNLVESMVIDKQEDRIDRGLYVAKRLAIRNLLLQLGQGISRDIQSQVVGVTDETAALIEDITDLLASEEDQDLDLSNFAQIPEQVLANYAQRIDTEGLKVSPEIWAANQTSRIETQIMSAIARGQSASNLATNLERFVLGGSEGMGHSLAYKAIRLARTEINNAYHETRRLSGISSPVVAGMQWRLSNRHPKWDVCDLLAEQDLYGMGQGVYPPDQLPPKPHPNCICFTMDQLRDPSEWQEPKPVIKAKQSPDSFKVDDAQGSERFVAKQYMMFTDLMDQMIGQDLPEPIIEQTFADKIEEAISALPDRMDRSEQDYIRLGRLIRQELASAYEAAITITNQLTDVEERSVRRVWGDLDQIQFNAQLDDLDFETPSNQLLAQVMGVLEDPKILNLPADISEQLSRLTDAMIVMDGELETLTLKSVHELLDYLVEELKQRVAPTQYQVNEKTPEIVKQTLSQVRAIGNQPIDYASGSNKEVKSLVDQASQLVPTDWLTASNSDPKKLWASKITGRAFYRPQTEKIIKGAYTKVGKLTVDPNAYDDPRSTALHELAHRVEFTLPYLQEVEQEFYNRRTAGESLEWMGKGYKESEETRPDDFTNRYMGKDYGGVGRGFEILSMGLEGVFYNKYNLYQEDQEYFDLILGLLGGI